MRSNKDLKELILTALAIVALFGIVLTGCGEERPYTGITGDPELTRHVLTLQEEAAVYGIDLSQISVHLEFGDAASDEHPDRAASCHPDSGVITVERGPYNLMLWESSKEAIVFHELGHCVLGRGHDNECGGLLGRNCKHPRSLMHERMYFNSYDADREYYVKELLLGVEHEEIAGNE